MLFTPTVSAASVSPFSRPPLHPEWPNPIAGFTIKEVTVGGDQRYYYLQTPPHATGPVPMVIALYGLYNTPGWMAHSTGLQSDARNGGIALAIPVMLGQGWNDGRFGPSGEPDEQFLLELVNQTVRAKTARATQIEIGGFSNGANMALVMASKHPKTFSAIVSISGELASASGAARPTGAIPAYFTHGLSDPVQPYGGRKPVNQKVNGLISEDATVAAFAKINGATKPKTSLLAHGPAASGNIQQIRYMKSASGSPVVLYRFPGVGHVWPTTGHVKVDKDVASVGFDAAGLMVRVAATVHR